MKTGEVLTAVLVGGAVVGGGYAAYTIYRKKHPAANTTTPTPASSTENSYLPKPYTPTEQLGIKPIDPSSPALAPKLAPNPDAVIAQMQADWDAKQKQMQADMEARYQADLAKQSAQREAETLALQRESQAREAEMMKRQQEELARQQLLIQQAEESRQRELETLRRQEEARKLAEQQRLQDRIATLKGQLADVQTQISSTESKLNTLDTSSPTAEFIESMRQSIIGDCRQRWGFWGWDCQNVTTAQGAERAKERWPAKIAQDRIPMADQLNALRARERGILDELKTLGATDVQPVASNLNSTPNSLATRVLTIQPIYTLPSTQPVLPAISSALAPVRSLSRMEA